LPEDFGRRSSEIWTRPIESRIIAPKNVAAPKKQLDSHPEVKKLIFRKSRSSTALRLKSENSVMFTTLKLLICDDEGGNQIGLVVVAKGVFAAS
jgi:hypothetical protein